METTYIPAVTRAGSKEARSPVPCSTAWRCAAFERMPDGATAETADIADIPLDDADLSGFAVASRVLLAKEMMCAIGSCFFTSCR